MLTDNLACVDFFLRSDEEAPTALKVVQRIGIGRARLQSDDRAVITTLDIPLPRLILEEAMGKDRFPCRSGKHVVVQPDDPS